MLPVVRGERETIRQIVVYTLVLIAITLAAVRVGHLRRSCTPSLRSRSAAYSSRSTLRLRSKATRPRAAFLFHYSLLYLALLFVAMAVDVL